MSERETLDQVTAERDLLAGLVEQHEARLRTFSADLQHVLLAEFSGEDLGHEYVGAWQRLHALIAPVATGYTPTPDEAVPASVARINALSALTDVQRLATYEKLMTLLHPERCDLVAYDDAHQAAMDAAIAELLNTQS
ncbi:hypothetical protein [Xanthomonas oryzae]